MRIVYTCPELASSVSSWSSCGKEWTKRYKCDTSFSTLLFSRTTPTGCSSGSTLKKKKGQTSDQCGSHHYTMGGLAYAKTPGLGPTVPQSGLFPLSADAPRQH